MAKRAAAGFGLLTFLCGLTLGLLVSDELYGRWMDSIIRAANGGRR